MRSTKMRTPALLLLLALLAPAAQARELEELVYLHDASGLHVAPAQINVEAGDVLTLVVRNDGQIVHDLLLCRKPGQTAGAPPASCDVPPADRTPKLQAGETARVTLALADAGTFWYYCDEPGHKAGGMAGLLQVQGVSSAKDAPLPLAVGVVALAAAAALLGGRRA